jgi:capsular polysaccharide biosynthesis protein/GGDEF domain-containing protein
MEIRLYFQMLRRGWWIIVSASLLALAVSLAISYLSVPQYRATASFILIPSSIALSSGPDVVRSYDTIGSVSVISTYAQIMNSARIYDDTLSMLKLQPQDLKDYTYQATVLPSTTILELSVTGPDPNVVAVLANTIGSESISYSERINSVFVITFLDTAVPPKLPVSPQPLLNGTVALVFGLVAGAVLAVLREQIRIPLEAYQHRLRLDPVTGVYSNRYFPRLVDEELAHTPNDVFSIGLIELTGLRDTLGTLPIATLQWMLKKVTDSLRKELRGNDDIGRLNEFSFEVLLPNTSATAASGIFERIYQALSEPLELGALGLTVKLDPHIGGAEYSNNISIKELFEKAENALDDSRRDNAKPVYIWGMRSPFWSQPEPNPK